MINITKSGSAVLITSNNYVQFPFQDGILSVPQNTLTYTLEKESDYITFRSASNNDVLFAASLNQITINDQAVSRETFVDMFNEVAYTEASSGGSGGITSETDPIFSAWKDTAFWQGTQAEYDALATKNPNTTYYIIEE